MDPNNPIDVMNMAISIVSFLYFTFAVMTNQHSVNVFIQRSCVIVFAVVSFGFVLLKTEPMTTDEIVPIFAYALQLVITFIASCRLGKHS